MAWTTPKTMANEPTLYTDWNTHVRDNLNYLKTSVSAQITIPASSFKPRLANGCSALTSNTTVSNGYEYFTLDFAGGTVDEYAMTPIFPMPADYNGQTFTYKVHWTHGSAGTALKVAWALSALMLGNGQALDTTFGTAVQVNCTGGGTAYLNVSAESAAVTPGGSAAANAPTVFRISRVASDATNDTMTIDAKLIDVQITYTRT